MARTYRRQDLPSRSAGRYLFGRVDDGVTLGESGAEAVGSGSFPDKKSSILGKKAGPCSSRTGSRGAGAGGGESGALGTVAQPIKSVTDARRESRQGLSIAPPFVVLDLPDRAGLACRLCGPLRLRLGPLRPDGSLAADAAGVQPVAVGPEDEADHKQTAEEEELDRVHAITPTETPDRLIVMIRLIERAGRRMLV